MFVKTASPSQGFDVNAPLSAKMAAAFKSAGNSFAIRYLPRTPALIPGNLTAAEMEIILAAGLSLMAVQHVSLPNWMPSAALGASYGGYAASYGKSIGWPPGAPIYCDLEEVSTAAAAQDVINYFTAWAKAVTDAEYVAGIYVGWQVILSDQQLYDLPTKSFWKAYNCDQSIPTRGWQILQHPQLRMSGIEYDPDTIQADELGDLPVWVSA